MDKFSSRSLDGVLIDSKKLIMVNYLMNLTEISRLQIYFRKKMSTTMGEMVIVTPPTGISLLLLSHHDHHSKTCYPMHLSPDFRPQSSIIWRL